MVNWLWCKVMVKTSESITEITVPGIQVPFFLFSYIRKKHFILCHTVDAHSVFLPAELCNRKERKSDFCKGRFKIGNS